MNSLTRREMLKLTSAAGLAGGVAPTAATSAAKTPRWGIHEIILDGPGTGNPFTDVQLTATFALGNRSVVVDGFYDGAGVYKVRFMPDTEGTWSYRTASATNELNGRTGSFECVAAAPNMRGPVGVRNQHHFAYADGTAYYPFGTTCYAWIHQSDALQVETLESLRKSPFNKIRMCVFPKHYEYNHNEPALYPFERSSAGVNDFTRMNPAFFAHLERRIVDLQELGIEADLILFHPYDRWGYATMTHEEDLRYLRYVVARVSAFSNVWWSLANEFDLMKAKSVQDFDSFFHTVEQHDPVGHLRSVHYSVTMYDYARPWVTHASLQTIAFDQAAEWLKTWRKPVVFDEVMYEGNLNRRWGNISGEEMTRRFWLGVLAGCYVTHGETFLDPDQTLDEDTTPTIWWSHGGKLRGTSPAAIGFLRGLVEASAPSGSVRSGLEAQANPYYLNASTTEADGHVHQILYFMDFHQPIFYEFPLPEGIFRAEMVDPLQRTVTALPGTFNGKSKIKLAGRTFQAVRFTRA